MKFDKSKVYTALNAEELEVGSEVILGINLESLKHQVEFNSWPVYIMRLDGVLDASAVNRFKSGNRTFNLAYLVRKVGEAKPEEKWCVTLVRGKESCYLATCKEFVLEDIIKTKSKLFVGTEEECVEWINAREKFTEVIKAWEDGKELQFRPNDPHLSWQECGNPSWDVDLEYRVKSEENSYRSYESSAEMIADFINRFKVKCPPYAEPLIWVKKKESDARCQIYTFYEDAVKFNNETVFNLKLLLDNYTYLDGSPVGMEARE